MTSYALPTSQDEEAERQEAAELEALKPQDILEYIIHDREEELLDKDDYSASFINLLS